MCIKKLRLLACLSIFGLFSVVSQAYGQNVSVELTLKSIDVEKTQEKAGDELYLDFLTYGKGSRPVHLRVPAKPHYWLSDMLSQLKDIRLLTVDLKDKQTKTVLVSLMEKDVPPWNVNDLLGSFVLTISGDGKPSYAVSGSTHAKKVFKPITHNMSPQLMIGHDAKYRLHFSLKMKGASHL